DQAIELDQAARGVEPERGRGDERVGGVELLERGRPLVVLEELHRLLPQLARGAARGGGIAALGGRGARGRGGGQRRERGGGGEQGADRSCHRRSDPDGIPGGLLARAGRRRRRAPGRRARRRRRGRLDRRRSRRIRGGRRRRRRRGVRGRLR